MFGLGFQRRKTGIQLPRLCRRLAARDHVFRAPPLTQELVAAIRLISPHCQLDPTEQSRQTWEADQNGACWGEFDALEPVLSRHAPFRRVLEIGPGLGRSLVFFHKVLNWKNTEVHAFEGEGDQTHYTMQGPRLDDSFCGNLSVLQQLLEYNDVHNVKLFNARDTQMVELPGPYDLLYSFYSIGFHWALDEFLDDLLPLMHSRSIAVFTVPRRFQLSKSTQKLPHQILKWKTAWPRKDWLNLLILGPGLPASMHEHSESPA